MPEARESFPEIENMDIGSLHERREIVRSRAPDGDFSRLDDESLAELLCIGRVLRRKSSAPGGPGKARKVKTPATLEDLA